MTERSRRLASLLCQHHLITTEQVNVAEKDAACQAIPFITSVVRHQFTTSEKIMAVCADHFKLPTIKLQPYDVTLLQDGIIATSMIEVYHLLPVQKDGHDLQVAVSDPTDHAALDAIRFHTGLCIYPVLADENELDHIIQTHCRPTIIHSQLKSALDRMDSPAKIMLPDEDASSSEEPIIQFVNQLLEDAINKNVSDIHIESFAHHCRIRFRQDGLLSETASLPHHFAARMVTRFKILANLDISVKRLPQDGRFSYSHRNPVDCRVSTCPGLHGENIVLRLLHHTSFQRPLTSLGMTPQQLVSFQQSLQLAQGLILVTGPTGSGKTATLYSAIQYLNQPEKNILTVEDPVEIDMPGITQVNINPRIGLDFAAALRAFLRQDPDIMMVGEIRDRETAEIAVHAAQTGHLVMATLHANHATDAIKRLLALGIRPCQLAGALCLLAAQRLLRQRCLHCLPQDDQPSSWHGCDHCHTGFKGRTGIFEIIPVSSAVTRLLLADADFHLIEKQFASEHHESLLDSGLAKIEAGITTYTEFIRVTGGMAHADMAQ